MQVREKQDRKAQIHAAAEKLFSEKGFLATSMRDIADALGIEAASLYSHIKSKDEVLWYIANRNAAEFFTEVEPIFQSNLHTARKLADMITAHILVITRNQNAAAVFFYEWKHLTGDRLTEYDALREKYEDMFREVVKQGITENLFRNYDHRFLTRTILSALNWTHTWYRADGDMRPEEIGTKLGQVLLNGLIRTI